MKTLFLFVLLSTSASLAAEVRTTVSGHKFFRDYSIPEFGEAWRDQDGLIWGDLMIGKTRGWIIRTVQFYAADNCAKVISKTGRRARLPTVAEYRNLMEKMSKKRGQACKNLRNSRFYDAQWIRQDYCPQILPNLDTSAWTSDLSEDQSGYHLGFRAIFQGAIVANPTDYEPELFYGIGAGDNRVDEEPYRCVIKSRP